MALTTPNIEYSNAALFRISFDRLPNTIYMCNSLQIPGLTLGTITQPTPLLDIKRPGDKIVYDPLTITFIVQEDLSNLIEIFNWIVGLGKPQSTDQYANFLSDNNGKKYCDATVSILSKKQNPKAVIRFIDAYPTAMSPIIYDASVANSTPLTATATFNYNYYVVEQL